jgi:hypothetical protein
MNPSDVVERLLGHSEIMERDKGKFVRFIDVATCTEAVDVIEALAAEIARLRKVLEKIQDVDRHNRHRYRQSLATGDTHLEEWWELGESGKIARAALGEKL